MHDGVVKKTSAVSLPPKKALGVFAYLFQGAVKLLSLRRIWVRRNTRCFARLAFEVFYLAILIFCWFPKKPRTQRFELRILLILHKEVVSFTGSYEVVKFERWVSWRYGLSSHTYGQIENPCGAKEYALYVPLEDTQAQTILWFLDRGWCWLNPVLFHNSGESPVVCDLL